LCPEGLSGIHGGNPFRNEQEGPCSKGKCNREKEASIAWECCQGSDCPYEGRDEREW